MRLWISKWWFQQRLDLALVVLVGLFFVLLSPIKSVALADEPEVAEQVMEYLSRAQIDEAIKSAAGLSGVSPRAEFARASLAFYRGDYTGASESLDRVGTPGLGAAMEALRERVEAAREATHGMLERREGGFVFRYPAGPEAILADYALPALEAQRKVLADLLGSHSEEPVLVEFFPSVQPFLAATGLPENWVDTTSTVAVAKWGRMMVLSPMNMGHGYPWIDTLAHEFGHLALSRATWDRAPIWFQEGFAKVLEGAWRDKSSQRPELSPWSESLLVRALEEEALLPFEAMHPSMAALPSQEMAALAFAQVSYAIDFVRHSGGDEGLQRVVEAIRGGTDAVEACEALLGLPPGGFEDAVRRHIRSQNLKVSAQIHGFDRQLRPDSAGDLDRRAEALDPVLLADRRLEERTRIGDLLRLRGHPDAALHAYEGASAVSRFTSPALETKRAHALRALGRDEEASAVLNTLLGQYPEHTPAIELLVDLAYRKGALKQAEQLAHRGIALNPFIPDLHDRLASIYESTRRPDAAARERVALQILRDRFSSP